MRRCGAIIFLTLLAAPFCARADEPAQPVPVYGTCAVPAREEWKAQEKFVWQQVCVGQVANFNSVAVTAGSSTPNRCGDCRTAASSVQRFLRRFC